MYLSNETEMIADTLEVEIKPFTETFPEANESRLFDKLVNVADNKYILDEMFNYQGLDKTQCFRYKARELEDQVILLREDLTEVVNSKKWSDHNTPVKFKPIPEFISEGKVKGSEGAILSNDWKWTPYSIMGYGSKKNHHLPNVNYKMISNDINKQHETKRNPEQSADLSEAVMIKRLNHQIEIKNRQLETCNSELNLFADIVENEYKETLRHLYTRLENVISRDGKYLSNDSKADLRRIQASFQKLKLLTEDIISYTMIDSDMVETAVDLNNTIKNLEFTLKHQITETGTRIHYNNLPIVTGQPLLISLLLQSIIENAIKFRSQDRNLVIFIHHYLVDGINLNNSEIVVNSKFTVLSVIDNGNGFESQHASNMFSPFFQLHDHGKYKGSGMGLPLCKKIMEIHQGFITAKSSNHNGSTFNCFFPSEIIRNITVLAIEK